MTRANPPRHRPLTKSLLRAAAAALAATASGATGPASLVSASLVPASIGAASILPAVAALTAVADDAAAQPVPRPRPIRGPDGELEDGELEDGELEDGETEAVDQGPQNLELGLDAIAQKDDQALKTILDGMEPGVDKTILIWRAMRQGSRLFSFGDIASFLEEYPDWPNKSLLRRRAEEALIGARPSGQTLLQELGDWQPITDRLKIEYAKALAGSGEADKAAEIVRPLWRQERLGRSNRRRLLSAFGDVLTRDDHKERAFRLLYNRDRRDAEQLLELIDADDAAIVKAWSAVLRRSKSADQLLDAVPEAAQTDPAYQFARIYRTRQLGQEREAAELLLKAPTEQEVLIEPDAWWVQRRILGRDIREDGDVKTAYEIVANHAAEGSRWIVEAEFHAGWFALRFNDDPKAAETHFQNILPAATIPASKARANYWLGRTARALDDPRKSELHFLAASRYPTTYYGQLAGLELGRASLDLPSPLIEESDQRWVAESTTVAAIERLYEIGKPELTIPFHVEIGDTAESAGIVALVVDIAEAVGDQRGALALGKRAALRLDAAQTIAFPTGALPIDIKLPKGLEPALIYAVSRQESAFNPRAVSPAGALGLMQLMPATARKVSRELGLSYSRGSLTADPSYNAKLGAAHLSELIEAYGGSYILTFAAYNAGPGQANKWIARFGDPRDPKIDVIDWVELISFGETRDYVQKLIENLQVYRALLSRHGVSIMTDLTRGRAAFAGKSPTQ